MNSIEQPTNALSAAGVAAGSVTPALMPGDDVRIQIMGGRNSKATLEEGIGIVKEGLGSLLPLEIEGPYGDSLSAHTKGARVVVLVAGGVGVTPMIALLRELLLQQQLFHRNPNPHQQQGSASGRTASEASPLLSPCSSIEFSFPPMPEIHLIWVMRAAQVRGEKGGAASTRVRVEGLGGQWLQNIAWGGC